MITTCLFDLGNVLVTFSHDVMYAQVGEVLGWPAEQVRTFLSDEQRLVRFETGRLTESELRGEFEQAVGRPLDPESVRLAACDIFQRNDPVIPIVHQLKELGIRLVLLSNTSRMHFDFIRERFDVLEPFDDFTTSHEVGAMKPDVAIYEDALSRGMSPPENTFFTDDIPLYTDAACEQGIRAFPFTTADALRNQLRSLGVSL